MAKEGTWAGWGNGRDSGVKEAAGCNGWGSVGSLQCQVFDW